MTLAENKSVDKCAVAAEVPTLRISYQWVERSTSHGHNSRSVDKTPAIKVTATTYGGPDELTLPGYNQTIAI